MTTCIAEGDPGEDGSVETVPAMAAAGRRRANTAAAEQQQQQQLN
jgi:hypothetical protein